MGKIFRHNTGLQKDVYLPCAIRFLIKKKPDTEGLVMFALCLPNYSAGISQNLIAQAVPARQKFMEEEEVFEDSFNQEEVINILSTYFKKGDSVFYTTRELFELLQTHYPAAYTAEDLYFILKELNYSTKTEVGKIYWCTK